MHNDPLRGLENSIFFFFEGFPQSGSCCDTGTLNTEDDNWELGQTDWFVGRQIGDCNNYHLATDKVHCSTLNIIQALRWSLREVNIIAKVNIAQLLIKLDLAHILFTPSLCDEDELLL